MIYLDIETLDFFQDAHIAALPRDQQLAAIRFGLAVTYRTNLDRWQEWHIDHAVNLCDLLGWCDLPIVGWNIIDFDLPVIRCNVRRAGYEPGEIKQTVVDLFALIRQATGRWYKLDLVAEANLGRQKLSHGQQATEWLRAGDPDSLRLAAEYCREDVQIVVDLHAKLLTGQPLRLPPRAQRNEINEILWWLDGRVERVPDAVGAVGIR